MIYYIKLFDNEKKSITVNFMKSTVFIYKPNYLLSSFLNFSKYCV